MNKYLRMLKSVFEANDLVIQDIEHTKRHLRITYSNGRQTFRALAACTPSDRRATLNLIAFAKRQARAC